VSTVALVVSLLRIVSEEVENLSAQSSFRKNFEHLGSLSFGYQAAKSISDLNDHRHLNAPKQMEPTEAYLGLQKWTHLSSPSSQQSFFETVTRPCRSI
jgi:hypothetical protein